MKRKSLLIDFLDQLKTQKEQLYKRSYAYVSQILSDTFQTIVEERNLTENKRLLELIESHKEKIESLNQIIIASVGEYIEKEKEKLNLMSEHDLNNLTIIGPDGFEKQVEKNLDTVLYEASNKAHVNLEINNILQRIQLEKAVLS